MEIGEEPMATKNNPRSEPPGPATALTPVSAESQRRPRRHSSLSRLQGFLAGGSKAPKSLPQIRWERRWTAASGAWFAVLLALPLGVIDWRAAMMVAATAFMLARSGDMLDNYDE
jgi:hypothetical protein